MRRRTAHKHDAGRGALDPVEEAVHLLRLAPAATLACYYIGSVPFTLTFLYFWADMSRSAFAHQRCGASAFALAVLFLWMKCWQAVFAQRLAAQRHGHPGPAWNWRRLWRLIACQAVVQPTGLFVLPLAVVLTVPFGWAYAFYQNVTALPAPEPDDAHAGTPVRDAWRLACVAPGENHALLFFLTVFAFFVFINLITAMLVAPVLLKMLLGVETVFTRGAAFMLNTTFLAAVCAMTYLCVDPLVKAVYVLRCFYGEAVRTGEDLRVELRGLATPARATVHALLLAATLGVAASTATAAPAATPLTSSPTRVCPPPRTCRHCGESLPSPAACGVRRQSARERPSPPLWLSRFAQATRSSQSGVAPAGSGLATALHIATLPGTLIALAPAPTTRTAPVVATAGTVPAPDLDRAIQDELARPDYAWRLPREKADNDENPGWLVLFLRSLVETVQNAMRTLRDWLETLSDWLSSHIKSSKRRDSDRGWLGRLHWMVYAVLAAVACVLAVFLIRLWRRRRVIAEATATPLVLPKPDPAAEHVTAEQLPSDEWLALARELVAKGELRPALRAMYLATLAYLGHHDVVRLARHKSNHEYVQEVNRRTRARPQVPEAFTASVALFERTWYGQDEVTLPAIESFTQNLERIRSSVEAR